VIFSVIDAVQLAEKIQEILRRLRVPVGRPEAWAHSRTAPVAAGLWPAVEPGVPPGGTAPRDARLPQHEAVTAIGKADFGRRDARPLRQAGRPKLQNRVSARMRPRSLGVGGPAGQTGGDPLMFFHLTGDDP
jgi:hypothetical protein